MARKAIAAEMALEDSRREKNGDASLTTLLLEEESVARVLRRKAATEQHIRTGAAWLRRIENIRLDDLKDALQRIQTAPEEETRAEEETRSEVESEARAETLHVSSAPQMEADENGQFQAVDESKGSEASYQTQSDTREDIIDIWYNDQISKLRVEQGKLREEQFRRRKAALRAEYWLRMDKMRNNATPSVINFG